MNNIKRIQFTSALYMKYSQVSARAFFQQRMADVGGPQEVAGPCDGSSVATGEVVFCEERVYMMELTPYMLQPGSRGWAEKPRFIVEV